MVKEARRRWLDLLEADPMNFFVRRQEAEFVLVRSRLAKFLGAETADLALAENATSAMNTVASSVPLSAGDEVLINDHEYGAVKRIWQRACAKAGAKLVEAKLPWPPESKQQVVDAITGAMSPRTRLVVFSHITSPTALILPAAEITAAVRQRGAMVCIDGPHAIAQLPVHLRDIDCDFYTASLHKWLCAATGSGFLYAHPRVQPWVQPAVLSWGRLHPGELGAWTDEFNWQGTRDPTSYLTIPTAIDFMETKGLPEFRTYAGSLARYGADLVSEAFGIPRPTLAEDWHGTMCLAELPPGESIPLREALWEQYQIHIPIVEWQDQRLIRISAHWYNSPPQMEHLAKALQHIIS